ncbi:hypothetical protein Tco_0426117, partial [Tanacetum coccineum]
ENSKRAGDELESDMSKKQKIDEHVEVEKDDQEEAEMKRHIEIVKDDKVATDAIHLATKPLVIVEYQIDKDGRMGYFKLIRADGSSKRYSSMIKMLQVLQTKPTELAQLATKGVLGEMRRFKAGRDYLLGQQILLEALDQLNEQKRPSDKPFRLPLLFRTITLLSSETVEEMKQESRKLGSISINRGLIQAIPTSLPPQPIGEATKASNLRRIPLGVQWEITLYLLFVFNRSNYEYWTMAGVDVNTLTIEQYLALSRENQAPGVVKPEIRGNVNFEIKSQFMRELREDTFSGNKDEDAHDHIDRLLSIVGLFNIPGVTKDAVILRVFPFTLIEAAKRWVDRLAPCTIKTRYLLKRPLSKGEESLYQAWEQYNDLLYKCPTHDINNHQKVNIFCKGLSIMNRQLLDSQGPIPGMRPADALTAIQTMADHSQKWHDDLTSMNIGSSSSKDGLAALVNKLDNLG